MIAIYQLKRALNYRVKHLNASLRQDATHFIYFFVLSLSVQLFTYFRNARKLEFDPVELGESYVDMTAEFDLFLNLFSVGNTIILLGLLIFGLFNLYVSVQRSRVLADSEFQLKFLTGSSSLGLTTELLLREWLSLPLIYLLAFNLTFFLVPDLVAFFNWALPLVEANQVNVSTFVVSLQSLPVLILVLLIFVPIFWQHIKNQVRP